METINPIFTTYLFDVEVVTPVHIGMAQEKNYVRGLDYIVKDKEVWIVSTDQLLRFLGKPAYAKELQDLTLSLAGGNSSKSEETIRNLIINNPDIKYQRLAIQGTPLDGVIRRMYRTGLGQYAIPGSSIKGAIRSILLAELKKQPGSNRKADELTKLMGDITNNLMRFIQVGDLSISEESVEIRRTKIYSADGDPNAPYSAHEASLPRGEWKDSGKHNKSFKDDSFITFYEMALPQSDLPNAENTLTIRLGTDLPKKLGEYATGINGNDSSQKANIPNYNYLLSQKPKNWLLDTVRAHTRQYLLREKVYFEKFQNKELKDINDHLDTLLKLNSNTNSCLLRVGAGVGFHSITGDWQEQDHFSKWNNEKGYLKNKTRKFAFEQVGGGIDFALMGFIKLTLQTPEPTANRELKRQQMKQQAEENARLALETEAKRLGEERIKLEQQKRVMFDGKAKKGGVVNAEVMTVVGAKATLKLYVTGQETDRLPLTYNGLAIGDFLSVEIRDISGKGKIMAIGFKSKY